MLGIKAKLYLEKIRPKRWAREKVVMTELPGKVAGSKFTVSSAQVLFFESSRCG